MNKKITSLTLMDKELFFLALLIGADELVGMEDPFRGYLTEEVEADWLALKAEMMKKGYLYEDATGLYIDEAVDLFVRTCATAETIARFSCVNREEKPIESYIYFGKEAVVEVQKTNSIQNSREHPNEYHLTLFGTPDEAMQIVDARIRLQEDSFTEVPTIRLPNQRFQEWREQASKSGTDATMAKEMIEQFNCSQDAANLLAQSLQQQHCVAQIILLSVTSKGWHVDGITFLSGIKANWLIRAEPGEQEDWVRITACSADQLRQLLHRLLAERVPLVTAV